MRVTWDPEKEKENIRKHKLGFSYAAEVFHDANRLVRYDKAHSGEEDRYINIGKAGDEVVVFVVETEYGKDETRIITARKANKRERKAYADGEV
ncbi:MAG: BrnT family toxin [Spirochaetaceae bacterium]|jgi:uncharacterized DUF497 family protein|nr:BrnT family toxin [Spirochaetaceae bacterium]